MVLSTDLPIKWLVNQKMRLQLAWTKIIICQDLFLSDYSEFKSLKWNVVVDLIWNLSKVILYGKPVDLKGGWRKLKAACTTFFFLFIYLLCSVNRPEVSRFLPFLAEKPKELKKQIFSHSRPFQDEQGYLSIKMILH